MKNEAHRDIDNIFRQSLEDPAKEPEFQERDWNAMEKKLDADRKPRKIVFWLPLAVTAAAMLLVFFGWWLIKPGVDPDKEGQQPVTINKGGNTKAINDAEKKKDQATIAVAPIDSNAQVNAPKALSFDDGKKPQHAVNRVAVNKASRIKTGAPANVPSNDSQQPVDEALIASNRSGALPQGNAATPNLFTGIRVASLTPVNVLPAASSAAPALNKDVKKPDSRLKPQLAVTVLASSDINGASSFKSAGTGKNIGLLFSARFGKVSISTGATYSVKPYTLPFSAYGDNSSYKFKYSPETVTADCRMIDLPFNIDYRIYNKNKNSITVGTGITSYIMTTENYIYYYGSSAYSSKYDVKNPDQYFFSAVNVQVNYRRQLSSKIGFNIQPYMKLPIKEIGYSRVRLQTAGVAIGLNWNINSSPK